LNSEQRRVVDLVMDGKSVFFRLRIFFLLLLRGYFTNKGPKFSGGAGTGKSFTLRKILESLPKVGTVATGPTGVAACHVGGTTLHSFAGIRPDGSLPKDPAKVGALDLKGRVITDVVDLHRFGNGSRHKF
jgi:hypothetical protein